MKKTLTITFEFDDGPWIDRETGEKRPTDPIAFAMDQVNAAVPHTYEVDFVNAKLDDVVLVSGNGYVSEEVKKRELQHQVFLEKVAPQFS